METTLEFREISLDDPFDPSTLIAGVPFTQASFYGLWQQASKRKVRRFVVFRNGKVLVYFQLIVCPLFRGRTYLYMPYGPVVTETSEELLSQLKSKLEEVAREERAAFVRLDFTPSGEEQKLLKFFKKGSRATYHGAYFQPRVEWFLNLRKSEEELIADMDEKTRYSLRLSTRREVTAEIVTKNLSQYLEQFYSLMSQTAKRNGFSLHPKSYYQTVFESLEKTGNGFLSIARYQEKILTVDVIVLYGAVATHIFGASSDEERQRLPAYAALWGAITEAKKRGYKDFNFGGISTSEHPEKGWEGLTAFKKKFGGREVQHSPFYDLVVQPIWYWLYTVRKQLKAAS